MNTAGRSIALHTDIVMHSCPMFVDVLRGGLCDEQKECLCGRLQQKQGCHTKISSCWVYLQLAELEGRLELNKTRKFFFQCAKKVVSDIPGLVDFAIRLVNSVSNLPDGQEN